ncbi:MAG: hypothetical protein JWP63_7090 [Candidatus Solibacter sp.]|nr:hypothetical protein [Candidatus Solibacter sp.]
MRIVRQVWAAALFAAIVFAINAHWFRAPIVEGSDYAANSLQVYGARIFHEMMGNYSRWQFHHPGPVYFYLFAFGERVWHDWLRVVPGTFNAQLVTLVLINTAFLFGAIEIFAKHFTAPMFRPLALAAAVLWMSMVNRTVPASAMVSAWMPHVALFAFLFFAAACASVAAGRAEHLPWMALGAMVMVHLHVAQILFAGGMSAAALVAGRVSPVRNRKAIAVSVAVLAVFLVPIVAELAIDRPNNLDDVRAYLERYPNPHLGIMTAAWYFGSFLAFMPDSTVATGLLARVVTTPYAAVYWVIFLAALGGAAAARKAPRFVWIVAGECVVISALFLVWADRITGALYNFNGYFIYATQLLALWAIAGVLAARWKVPVRVAWVVPFVAMVAMAGTLRNPDRGSDAIGRMSDTLRGKGAVHRVFQHDDWDSAAGIANQLARRGLAFCVDAEWYYMFGRQYVCGAGETWRVVVTGAVVFESGRRPLGLPVAIGADDVNALREGFYECEQDHCWTGRRASVGFTLADGVPEYRVTITGSALPERPVEVLWNGVRIGRLDGLWKSSATLVAPGGAVRSGEMNRLTFECPGAGPIAGDSRELGFSLMKVEIAR